MNTTVAHHFHEQILYWIEGKTFFLLRKGCPINYINMFEEGFMKTYGCLRWGERSIRNAEINILKTVFQSKYRIHVI